MKNLDLQQLDLANPWSPPGREE